MPFLNSGRPRIVAVSYFKIWLIVALVFNQVNMACSNTMT